jgi:hypothetical protein
MRRVRLVPCVGRLNPTPILELHDDAGFPVRCPLRGFICREDCAAFDITGPLPSASGSRVVYCNAMGNGTQIGVIAD